MDTSWKRWQDWAIVGLGVILAATPFVFGIDLGSAPAITAYVGGVTLVLGGLFAASMADSGLGAAWLPLIVGVAVFAAPWALGFNADPVMAGFAWIVGVLVVLTSGSEMLFRPEPTAA